MTDATNSTEWFSFSFPSYDSAVMQEWFSSNLNTAKLAIHKTIDDIKSNETVKSLIEGAAPTVSTVAPYLPYAGAAISGFWLADLLIKIGNDGLSKRKATQFLFTCGIASTSYAFTSAEDVSKLVSTFSIAVASRSMYGALTNRKIQYDFKLDEEDKAK